MVLVYSLLIFGAVVFAMELGIACGKVMMLMVVDNLDHQRAEHILTLMHEIVEDKQYNPIQRFRTKMLILIATPWIEGIEEKEES